MYYFIDEETKELVIVFVYVNNIYFMSLKRFSASLRVEVKIHEKMRML